ncbi:MAG: hypothetical protein NWQ32_06390 [Paracoccaceae bacterium]|nr:hypothetical protein [Paracoccaceae bacterium]MDP5348006.1 hypothetical protein [Paracoccaceae bacterium]
MTLVLFALFLAVPLLVWRYFRARRVAITVIALWLGPVLFLLGFDLAMSGCANVPYTAVAGYLDCPTRTHELAYAVFGPPAGIMVVLLLSHGLLSLALFLSPLIIGLALELILRRTRR